jgi:hypothetical protein
MAAALEDVVAHLISTRLATAEQIVPCTAAEIEELRTGWGGLLPEYERFLETMGRGAGGLLTGTDFFYPDTLDIHDIGMEILRDDDKLDLFPAGATVIGLHQGYQLYWLEPDGAVRHYTEERGIIGNWPSLEAFLLIRTDLEVEAYTYLRKL